MFGDKIYPSDHLGGGFKYFFYFHPYLGKIPILTNIFQMGLVQPPTSHGCYGIIGI